MKDNDKTKEQLIKELSDMRLRVAKLEISEAELKQTENSLNKERSLLKALMDNIPDHIYFKDVNSRFIIINNSLAKIFNISTPAQAVGKTDFDYFTDEHARSAFDIEQTIISTGQSIVGIEEKETWADSPDSWVSTTKLPLRDENGNIIGIFGISRDITDHKKAEETLLESETRYKELFDKMNNGVAVYEVRDDGNDFIFKDFNKAAESIDNVKREDLIGKSIFEMMPEVEKFGLIDVFRKVWKTGEPVHFPVMFYEDLKRKGWYENFVYKLPSGEIVTVYNNITERKQSEIINRIQYNIAKSVVKSENVEQLLSLVNSELFQLLEITNFFAAFYQPVSNTLKKMEWVDGKVEFEELNAEKSLAGYVIKTAKTMQLNKHEIAKLAEEQNIPITNPSVECWLGVPLIVDKKAIGVLVTKNYTNPKACGSVANLFEQLALDVSIFIEKVGIMNDLHIAKVKAEESDRLKSAFLANMSHEIRTPMNGILGFSELLREPNLTGEEQQKYVEIIQKSGVRMLNIINDIVDISKIEAGLMKLDIIESNINEQIEYIYTFFKPEVEAKKMKLFFKNTLPEKKATIKTDREKVFAILTNLVKNAIKYSNKGSIKVGYVLTNEHFKDKAHPVPSLQFFVKDTGMGIPKNRQKAIFERFIQANNEDKKNIQGAGLGLAISKAYVEMLGGKLWVESEEGIGSNFYFTLPYNPPEEKISVEDDVVPDKADYMVGTEVSGLKILIVEDDNASDLLITIVVKKLSREIIKGKTGQEAIEACRNNPDIDLILMDIQMPKMNGYEATSQIRKFNKDVIIIAQTAYGLSGDREKALEAGCNDYISKPINKKELQALIQKYFKK
ncbi:MAG: PAS domain-containing protein [Bacteroidales bacterium]|nr:PAS domain-containing protein [Bacteroidales bacterium]